MSALLTYDLTKPSSLTPNLRSLTEPRSPLVCSSVAVQIQDVATQLLRRFIWLVRADRIRVALSHQGSCLIALASFKKPCPHIACLLTCSRFQCS
jgi:hypothetical protein